jgi:secreted PhoX family phosphatase
MLTRRKLLTITGLALGFAALGRTRNAQARGRWGAPIPDPNRILDLPAGFSYAIVEDAGQLMSDGYRMPGRPDGMACFAGPAGTLILMRNHENSLDAVPDGPYSPGQGPAAEAYDPGGMGGVSRVVIDDQTFERISSNLVLIGTVRNCAGGPSPWGWLSCEENVEINGEYRHGYVFVCSPDAETVQAAQPVVGYGRCNHEAVAVDPSTNIAYLTEDRLDSCLYRFVPDAMAEPFVGKLQALMVVDQPGLSTLLLDVGEVLAIEWVDIDQPDPDEDTLREEARDKGGALILRGEGIWFFEGQLFIAATAGGPLGKGQIFRLIDGDNPTLELLTRADDAALLDMPDNITVAPWGELFLVEDGTGTNSIRWLTAEGELCEFGRTTLSEMAGICFAPDGRAMFLNIQAAGLTLVITGPFVDDGGEDTGTDTDSEGEGDSDTETSDSGEGTDSAGETGDDEVGESDSETSGAPIDGDDTSCSCAASTSVGTSTLVVAAAAVVAATLRRGE